MDIPVSEAAGTSIELLESATPSPPPAAEPLVTVPPPVELEVAQAWAAPLPGASVASCYGWRSGSLHQGIDLVAALGTAILAIGDGTVVAAGPAQGFGNWVVIEHDDGSVSVYGHMRYYDVAVGDRVETGEQIALVGNEGQSTGPHLHMEIKLDGQAVDPDMWLDAQGVELGAH